MRHITILVFFSRKQPKNCVSRITVTNRFKMYTAWVCVTYIAVQGPYLIVEEMHTCYFL